MPGSKVWVLAKFRGYAQSYTVRWCFIRLSVVDRNNVLQQGREADRVKLGVYAVREGIINPDTELFDWNHVTETKLYG